MNGGLLPRCSHHTMTAFLPSPSPLAYPHSLFILGNPKTCWTPKSFYSLLSCVFTHLSPYLFPSSPVMKMLSSRWNTTLPGCSRKKRRKWEVLNYWFSWQFECLSSGHHNRRPQLDLNSRFIFSQFWGLQIPVQHVRVVTDEACKQLPSHWSSDAFSPGSHGEWALGCPFLLISPIRLGPTLMTSVNLNHLPQGPNSKYSLFQGVNPFKSRRLGLQLMTWGVGHNSIHNGEWRVQVVRVQESYDGWLIKRMMTMMVMVKGMGVVKVYGY